MKIMNVVENNIYTKGGREGEKRIVLDSLKKRIIIILFSKEKNFIWKFIDGKKKKKKECLTQVTTVFLSRSCDLWI